MATVLSVERGRSTLRLTLDRDGQRETLRILSFDEKAIGEPLTEGGSLSDSALERLPRLVSRHTAVETSVRLLALRDHSAEGLKTKLLARGVLPESADFAVALMQRQGYIREADQLLARIEGLFASKRWGPHRLVDKLVAEGYPEDGVRSALARLEEEGRLDFDGARRALLAAYRAQGLDYPHAMAKLGRMGYASED